MIVKVLDVVIAGLLMGGIYALIAVGLSLQYGVARVLNIAHGEFIMLGAFASWMLFTTFGVNPMISLVICASRITGSFSKGQETEHPRTPIKFAIVRTSPICG